jgi:hypothetical protein
MNSHAIVSQLDKLLHSGQLQSDLSQLTQLRETKDINLDLQLTYIEHERADPYYLLRMKLNGKDYETEFKRSQRKNYNLEAFHNALERLLSQAAVHIITGQVARDPVLKEHFM